MSVDPLGSNAQSAFAALQKKREAKNMPRKQTLPTNVVPFPFDKLAEKLSFREIESLSISVYIGRNELERGFYRKELRAENPRSFDRLLMLVFGIANLCMTTSLKHRHAKKNSIAIVLRFGEFELKSTVFSIPRDCLDELESLIRSIEQTEPTNKRRLDQ
jgi:hypothetical protein